MQTSIRLVQETSVETTLCTYPEIDLEQLRNEWVTRYNKLGIYMTGPRSWMDLDLTSPSVIVQLEQKESWLSKEILKAFDAVFAHRKRHVNNADESFRILIVGFGPGRRIIDYITRAKKLGGVCYGVDALEECVDIVHQLLINSGLLSEREKFQQGLASEVTKNFAENSFDLIIWERLGNHILDDKVWRFALKHEVTNLLKPRGLFMLAESLAELNPHRKFNPESSKPRTLRGYCAAMLPKLHYKHYLQRFAKFGEDHYLIGFWQKQSQSC